MINPEKPWGVRLILHDFQMDLGSVDVTLGEGYSIIGLVVISDYTVITCYIAYNIAYITSYYIMITS